MKNYGLICLVLILSGSQASWGRPSASCADCIGCKTQPACEDGAAKGNCKWSGTDPKTGVCVNLDTDSNNCGALGQACLGGQACDLGTCTCPGTGVTDLLSDSNHCGSCGNACPSSAPTCVSGSCRCTDCTKCIFLESIDIPYGQLANNGFFTPVDSAITCCQLCQQDSECNAFTYTNGPQWCFLKSKDCLNIQTGYGGTSSALVVLPTCTTTTSP